jgi:hypothetical protein
LGQVFSDDRLTLVTALGGDVNLDGVVNRVDLTVFARSYGAASGADWGDGDFDGDGAIGLADLSILKAYYGRPAPSPSWEEYDLAVVPEPPTWAMLVALAGAAGLLPRKRRMQ